MKPELTHRLLSLLNEYHSLGIAEQIDYKKFYLYSIITHSTAIEGSTVTEIENQLLFDEGITAQGRSLQEQMMNLDLKAAYEQSFVYAQKHTVYSVDLLCGLSALVMKNTGSEYSTLSGNFSAAKGELRLLNVSAGIGGKSYLSFQKVPERLSEFCQWLNAERAVIDKNDIGKVYDLSFEAHYRLVNIHPWADGNGRMSRLVMNMIQHEFGMVPSIVKKEKRKYYITSLEQSERAENSETFKAFMLQQHCDNLLRQIEEYKVSMEDVDITNEVGLQKSGQKNKKWPENWPKKWPEKALQIVDAISSDPSVTIAELEARLEVGHTTVKKLLRAMQAEGIIRRVGPDKGGHWEVTTSIGLF
jgi:Fic family protein